MIAIMINDEYRDLVPGYPYEVEVIKSDYHMKIKGSKRNYCTNDFVFFDGDEKISPSEAYRRDALRRVMYHAEHK